MKDVIETPKKDDCLKDNKSFPCFIPAQRMLKLISKKWGIRLIYLLKDGKRIRYHKLRDMLQKGWKKDRISDATLSTRLNEFTKEGLLQREVFPELPPKVEYFLTKKGENLASALLPLIDWTIEACHGQN